MIENYRLIYPNLETDRYEEYMSGAKLVWEEFTGSGKTEIKINSKREKPIIAAVQPIKLNGIINSIIVVDAEESKEIKITKEIKDSKEINNSIVKVRKRPVSAIPYSAKMRLSNLNYY